jgi:hypothetical protein
MGMTLDSFSVSSYQGDVGGIPAYIPSYGGILLEDGSRLMTEDGSFITLE